MTYQDYFKKTDFEDIWTILNIFYGEDERLKSEYMNLVNEIKNLPIDPQKSYEAIKIVLDSDNEILVEGAPDPQEWLVGREVNIDFTHWNDFFDDEEIKKNNSGLLTFDSLSGKEKRDVARNSDTATLAAHLLYWSTLYAIKTAGQHRKEFSKWIDDLEKGIPRVQEFEKEYVSESFRKKSLKYWKESIAKDSAIDWSYNLWILKKKIEFNIGYWRYVQRHIGWEEEVKRMILCCNLLDIVARDYPDMSNVYVNVHNSSRFNIEIDNDNTAYWLEKLRRIKAHKIVWRFIEHNIKKWWD